MKYKRVVQLELNEISPFAIKKLIDDGKLPNFKKIWHDWQRTETVSEDVYEHIEPWIQWVTAHTGKSFNEHKIFRLGDAHELKHDQIWEVLSDRGVESAVVGAMNAKRGRARDGVFFPDPWAKENDAFPEKLQGLWRLISSRVQAHAASQPSWHDIWQALQATRMFKISPLVCARIAAQLMAQKRDPNVKWRLAALFDLFLAELFVHLLKDPRFGFCSLFLNSVAHYQHHFWRNFQPEEFNTSVVAPDCRPGDNPLQYGYEIMDEIVGRVLQRVNLENTLIIVASGLSQVPDTRHEEVGGMNYYRLKDHKQFAAHLQIHADAVFPLMSRDWQIHISSDDDRRLRKEQLAAITVNGEALFQVSETTPGYIFVETAVTRGVGHDDVVIYGDRVLGKFHDLFVNIAVKSGHHTGVGVLWASGSAPGVSGKKSVPLADIFQVAVQALA